MELGVTAVSVVFSHSDTIVLASRKKIAKAKPGTNIVLLATSYGIIQYIILDLLKKNILDVRLINDQYSIHPI